MTQTVTAMAQNHINVIALHVTHPAQKIAHANGSKNLKCVIVCALIATHRVVQIASVATIQYLTLWSASVIHVDPIHAQKAAPASASLILLQYHQHLASVLASAMAVKIYQPNPAHF